MSYISWIHIFLLFLLFGCSKMKWDFTRGKRPSNPSSETSNTANTPPSFTIETPDQSPFSTTLAAIEVTGSCSKNITNIYLKQQTDEFVAISAPDECQDEKWSYQIKLADGTNEIQFKAVDDQDNQILAHITIIRNPLFIQVEPWYPINGRNWNDYIKRSDAQKNIFDQPDISCNGTETGDFNTCIHAGVLRKIILPQYSTCNDLTINETLNAFEWECVILASQVAFRTKGFKQDKSLADLIVATGWKPNLITISFQGKVIASTDNTSWWSNPVTPLPDNASSGVSSLDTKGTIYTLSESKSTLGYIINEDKISIVSLNGSILMAANNITQNCNSSSGTSNSADLIAIICSGDHKHLWLQGSLNGGSTAIGIYTTRITHSVLNNMTILNSTKGIWLKESSHNHISQIEIYDASGIGLHVENQSNFNIIEQGTISRIGSYGLYLYYVLDNLVRDLNISHCASMGIYTRATTQKIKFAKIKATNNLRGLYLRSCNNCVASDVLAYNNTQMGIYVYESAQEVTLSKILVANNGTSGLEVSAPNNIVGIGITAVNNGGDGILLLSDGNVLTNILVAKNGQAGLSITGDNNRFHNIVAVDNTTYGVSLSTSNFNDFTGRLGVGGNGSSDCFETGGSSNQGLNNSCSSTHGASNFAFVPGLSSTNTFLGSIGDFTYDVMADWFDLDGNLRTVGLISAGQCTAGTCKKMDWSVQVTDNTVRNINGPFTINATCPASVDGSLMTINTFTAPDTFLLNAIELLDDGSGDDDALCESHESCLFLPNIGMDQNQQSLQIKGPCYFVDNIVQNVTMFGY